MQEAFEPTRSGRFVKRFKRGASVLAGFVMVAGASFATALPVSAVVETIVVSVPDDTVKTDHPEGAALSPFTVGSFTDTIACPTPSTCVDANATFTATIGWGDGTSGSCPSLVAPLCSFGTGVNTVGTTGQYSIDAQHSWADEANAVTCTPPPPCGYPIHVTVVNTGTTKQGSGTNALGSGLYVGDQLPLSSISGYVFAPTAQLQFTGKVGSFHDDNHLALANDGALSGGGPEFKTLSINWGDGQPVTTGTATLVSCATVNGGLGVGGCDFDIAGTHTYSAAGTYPVNITVGDGANAVSPVSVTSTANVSADVVTVSVIADSTASDHMEGVTYAFDGSSNPTIATFADAGACNPTCVAAGSYTATITWGDGQTGAGTVAFVSQAGTTGNYSVTASHAFVDESAGVLTHVVVTNTTTSAAGSGDSTGIAVQDQSLTANASSFTPSPNVAFTGMVASLLDGNPLDTVGTEFTASIVWGDGSVSSAGTVAIGTCTATCPVSVSGTHTYTSAGSYTATVTVTDGTGNVLPIFSSANVGETTTCGSAGTPKTISVPATPSWVTACSQLQPKLTGSNGTTWQPMDTTHLSVTFTPSVDTWAIISGNADLWTSTLGFNQDLGVMVSGGTYPSLSGQPEAWKESGGKGGTFSPNAAFVQTAIHLAPSVPYAFTLVWKTNQADAGSIYSGAGPLGGKFSPTRLSVELVPTASAVVFTKSVTATQPKLTGNNGASWADMDTTNLSLPFTTPAGGPWVGFVSGNADLWTSSAGFNQDIGVTMSGPGFPSTANQPEAWTESGGSTTLNPNAAFVQAPLTGLPGSTSGYLAKLQWKASKADAGTIFAGAGPIGAKYSPTTITVVLVPASGGPASGGSGAASSITQYTYAGSDGMTWHPMDMTNLMLTITPDEDSGFKISGGSALWTTSAGFNQDLAIMISGGAYGTTGVAVAWKESGGSHTYAPNATFVTSDLQLQSGVTYTVWLAWKANKADAGTIWAGAGPVNQQISATSLTAQDISG